MDLLCSQVLNTLKLSKMSLFLYNSQRGNFSRDDEMFLKALLNGAKNRTKELTK